MREQYYNPHNIPIPNEDEYRNLYIRCLIVCALTFIILSIIIITCIIKINKWSTINTENIIKKVD